MKVGLLIIATNKYSQYVQPLVESAEDWFLLSHEVTYFVFTDQPAPPGVVRIEQPHLPWPGPTLMRYHILLARSEQLERMDYLFYVDADMRFVGPVGDEILGERVATLHPGFYQARRRAFTYETRPASRACVAPHEGHAYYAGGFGGGTSAAYLAMAHALRDAIDEDSRRGLTAVWHDESHLNRYLIDHPPTVTLSPAYCYPESWRLPFERRLLALDKDHAAMRAG